MNKREKKTFFVLSILLILALTSFEGIGKMKKNKENTILRDEQILENYRHFQDVARDKKIGLLSNEAARSLPEVKKILDQRDARLAEIALGCTGEYRASVGTPSVGFVPIAFNCTHGKWWRWLW